MMPTKDIVLLVALVTFFALWVLLISIGMRRHAKKKPPVPDGFEPAPAPPAPAPPAPVNVGKATALLVFEDGRRVPVTVLGNTTRGAREEVMRWLSFSFSGGFFATAEKNEDGQETWFPVRHVKEVLVTVTDHFMTPGEDKP